MKIIMLAAVSTAALIACSAPAFADTVTTTGTLPAICTVTVSNQAFDINTRTLQRIADLKVQCNDKNNPNLKVQALNGYLKNGSVALSYTSGVDLNGPINSVQTSQTAGTTSLQNIGLSSGPELASGVPGDMTMVVATAPWAAGTYTETFTLTIG